MVELYGVTLDEKVEPGTLYYLMQYFSQEKIDRISRLRMMEDRLRTVTGEMLIRNIVMNKLGLSNERIKLNENKYGKPHLEGDYRFHFNVSHSGSLVVCAVDDEPVGVDVEKINTIDYSIAQSFFFKSEFETLANKTEKEKLGYFYDLWTLKESFIKAEGKGLNIPLDTFEICTDKEGITVKTDISSNRWNFKQYHVNSEYKLSVCAAKNTFCSEPKIITFQEMTNMFLNSVLEMRA